MTPSINPANYDFRSILVTALSICRKTISHVYSQSFATDKPPLRATASVYQNLVPRARKFGTCMRQESHNKKKTFPPLAIRYKSDNFLCRPRILGYTTRLQLHEAFGPELSFTSENLNSVRRLK